MTTRITYSQANNTGKMLAQAVNHVLDSLSEMRRLKGILDSSTSGSDFASLAIELGGSVDATSAQAVWSIISTAADAIDVAEVAELSRLDQG